MRASSAVSSSVNASRSFTENSSSGRSPMARSATASKRTAQSDHRGTWTASSVRTNSLYALEETHRDNRPTLWVLRVPSDSSTADRRRGSPRPVDCNRVGRFAALSIGISRSARAWASSSRDSSTSKTAPSLKWCYDIQDGILQSNTSSVRSRASSVKGEPSSGTRTCDGVIAPVQSRQAGTGRRRWPNTSSASISAIRSLPCGLWWPPSPRST